MARVQLFGAQAVKQRVQHQGIEVLVYQTDRNLDLKARQAVVDGANYYRDRVRQRISRTQGEGRIYSHPLGGSYRASGPGRPPVFRLGNLHAGIQVSFVAPGQPGRGGLILRRGFQVMVGVGNIGRRSRPYGRFLEAGTVNMDERPFLLDTYMIYEDQIEDIMARSLNKDVARLRSRQPSVMGDVEVDSLLMDPNRPESRGF